MMTKIGAKVPQESGFGNLDMTAGAAIQAVLDHSMGTSLAGAINIESGSVEFSSHPPKYACSACRDEKSFSVACDSCDRRPGNNVSFPAGDGDGAYASVGFYGSQGMVAAVWLFDEHNSFAGEALTHIDTDIHVINPGTDLLFSALEKYVDLPGEIVGEIDASDRHLLVGDRGLRAAEDALVSHPFSEGLKYKIVVFAEPALAGSVVAVHLGLGGDEEDYTGGFPESVRPRIAIAVESSLAEKIFPAAQDAQSNHDWDIQHGAWKNGRQNSNFAASNGPRAALSNGFLWLHLIEHHQRLLAQSPIPLDDFFNHIYVSECLGWFVQAALEGQESAENQIRSLSSLYPGELSEESFLRPALARRGMGLHPEVLEFVSKICGE